MLLYEFRAYHFTGMIFREFLVYINQNGSETPTFTKKFKAVMEKAVTNLGFCGILSFASVCISWISQFCFYIFHFEIANSRNKFM